MFQIIRRFQLMALVVALAFVVGCAGKFVKNSYRSLAVSQNQYEVSLSILGDLYKEGKITSAEKDNIIKYARMYKVAHNEAVKSLEMYALSDYTDKDAKVVYLEKAALAASRLTGFLAAVAPYLE